MLRPPGKIVMRRIRDKLDGLGAPIEPAHKNWLRISLSTAVVLGLGLWLASYAKVNTKDVFAAIQEMGWTSVALAFLGCFFQVLFIIWRYYVFIPADLRPDGRRVVYSIGLGHLLNTFMPARAGDVLKCFLLSKGKDNKLTLFAAAGVLVGDRIIDVGVLLLMAVLWKAYQHPQMIEWISGIPVHVGVYSGIGVVVALALTWFFLLRKGSLANERWGGAFWKGMNNVGNPRILALTAVLAFLSWSGEVLALKFLAEAQGTHLTFGNAVFVLVALNLAISVPLSLANVGPFEAAIALSLTSFGMESSQAVAVATVHHALQLLVIGLWGLISVAVRPREPKLLPGPRANS